MIEPADISVVIPCYNGSLYICDTINSILIQQDVNFEIIVIDDGSTDNSALLISGITDSRLKYKRQENKGVSAARNAGLNYCSGKFVVFFDADDKMLDRFLKVRYEALNENDSIDFVCGEVQNFTNKIISPNVHQGACYPAEILLYTPYITTCPSNYMFRRTFLNENKIIFNTLLASTADRLFLMQSFLKSTPLLIKNEGRLLYRISENSMSHHLTSKLLNDNELYYSLLVNHNLIPSAIRKEALVTGNLILFKSAWKLGKKLRAARLCAKAFLLQPIIFLKKL